MKKSIPVLILIPFLIFSFSCSSHDGVVNPLPNKIATPLDKDAASTSGIFGINLLQDINKTESDSNIIISPLSIATALGMTLNGAKGDTYSQMLSTLQLSGNSQVQVNQAYQSLNNTLSSADPGVTFTDANSIWCRQDVSFEQNFLSVNQKYFNADIQSLNFANPATIGIINTWVSDNTAGKITNIINNIPANAVMYLINAIYFKASWQSKFDSSLTRLEPFYPSTGGSVQCEMMNQQNDFNYYSVSDYQALQVPYGSGNFSMLIILPNTGIDINYLLNELNGALLNRINAGMAMQLVTLVLPRFQVSYCDSLKSPLIDLGMVNAFNPSLADFSYINPMLQLYISNVIHKTYVKVGEQGTEAAAATAVVMGTSCAGPTNPRLVFNVDHPFIFFIIEKNSGAILFAGKIVNPLN